MKSNQSRAHILFSLQLLTPSHEPHIFYSRPERGHMDKSKQLCCAGSFLPQLGSGVGIERVMS